jgi:hypothetical protein
MKTKLLALAALVWLGATATDASACGGGMFVTSSSSTATATGHRVVISLSSTQTVLWDQITFNGNPTDFAWVLPVKKGAYLEVASDAFLEVLEAGSAVKVNSPGLDCGSRFSCMCAPGAVAGGGDGASEQVTVVHQGTAGPYDTVTLSTDAGNGAIASWLTMNGYAIPADVAPILDDYVAQDFDFIAIKLQPAQTTTQMQPVRVVTPGGAPTFPLRMLTAGAGETIGLTLYVLSEGRIEAAGFKNAIVPESKLVFDFQSNQSNYQTLRDAIFAANPDTFVTASATKNTLLNPDAEAVTFNPSQYNEYSVSIAEAYFTQALANGETSSDCADARANVSAYSASFDKVFNPCNNPVDPTICGDLLPFRIDARMFICDNLTDLSVALTGLHPATTWLTRLEARLPKNLLLQDLTLVPASSQSEQPTWLDAPKGIHAPCDLAGANISGIRPTSSAAAMFTALVGLFITLARRKNGKNAVA